MNPWLCALLITIAGACGGVVNALLSDNSFPLPRRESGMWCPSAVSNIRVGAFAAFSSWAFYGSLRSTPVPTDVGAMAVAAAASVTCTA